MPRPAVFLDRDGTINVRARAHRYITDVSDFAWLPGAEQGMVTIARAGLPLIVVSNQRGVSRGMVSLQTLSAIEERIQDRMRAHGCEVSAFRYCPHGLDDSCGCRKPKPGMLLAAALELDIDLSCSWMVGDSPEDMEAGRAAGARTIRIAADHDPQGPTVTDLTEAAALILGQAPSADVPAVDPARHGIR